VRYVEFQNTIQETLLQHPAGLTWVELKEMLSLPYKRPCPTWVQRMEQEIGLSRTKGEKRAYVWKIEPEQKGNGNSDCDRENVRCVHERI